MNDVCSTAFREEMAEWLKRYPKEQQRSGVIEALRIVQEENGGSLTVELMDAVAEYLQLPNIAVYEVATFYTMYNLQPVGKHIINVCTNISCQLRGSSALMAHLKKTLGVEVNETTADGAITLREVECLGACVGAPAVQIGKAYHECVTPEKMTEILAKITVPRGPHGK